MRRLKLSANFYLDEFTRSSAAARYGIDTSLSREDEEFGNLQRLCFEVLQPLREVMGPVHITSGYRPIALNSLVRGSLRSQHIHGLAADIVVSGHAPIDVARWIYTNIPHYDQVIHEFGQWTHVSVAGIGEAPRRQPLTSYLDNGATKYIPGLTGTGGDS